MEMSRLATKVAAITTTSALVIEAVKRLNFSNKVLKAVLQKQGAA